MTGVKGACLFHFGAQSLTIGETLPAASRLLSIRRMSAIRSLVTFAFIMVAVGATKADPPVLSGMVRDWPYERFTLEGDLNGCYVIESSTNLIDWIVVSTNRYPQAKRSIAFDGLIFRPRRFFRAWRLREPIFRHALACFQSIDINHESAEVDSFDSASPSYSTDGWYDPVKRKGGGDVAVNSGLFGSLDIGNAKIMGRVQAEGLRLGPNASVGSRAWVEAGNTGVEPGWTTDNHEMHTYRVVPPFTNAPSPPPGTVNGTNYAYVLEAGNYLLPSLDSSIDGRMYVVGNAVLYVQGNASMRTDGSIEIAPGASLKLYVGGNSISITGNGIVNRTGNALNFQLYTPNRVYDFLITSYFSPNVTNEQSLIGTIYAPDTDFWIDCTQVPFHFMGAIVGRTAHIAGQFKLHFDENLRHTLQR